MRALRVNANPKTTENKNPKKVKKIDEGQWNTSEIKPNPADTAKNVYSQ